MAIISMTEGQYREAKRRNPESVKFINCGRGNMFNVWVADNTTFTGYVLLWCNHMRRFDHQETLPIGEDGCMYCETCREPQRVIEKRADH